MQTAKFQVSTSRIELIRNGISSHRLHRWFSRVIPASKTSHLPRFVCDHSGCGCLVCFGSRFGCAVGVRILNVSI